jgi:uncharacterized membrane protein
MEEKALTLESSKNLGGVGAILLLVGTLPYLSSYSFGILALVGLILILVGLNGLANVYKERGIFNNSLYGLIAGIVGVVIAVVVLFVAVLSSLVDFLQEIYPSWNGDWSTISSLSGMTPNTSNITMSSIVSLLGGLLSVFVVLWIFVIIWAFFARRSLKMLATKSSVGLFSTAALLLLIGAVLTIVLIGFLLMWIAVLLMAIAFFQIRPQAEQPLSTVAPPPLTPTPM